MRMGIPGATPLPLGMLLKSGSVEPVCRAACMRTAVTSLLLLLSAASRADCPPIRLDATQLLSGAVSGRKRSPACPCRRQSWTLH